MIEKVLPCVMPVQVMPRNLAFLENACLCLGLGECRTGIRYCLVGNDAVVEDLNFSV